MSVNMTRLAAGAVASSADSVSEDRSQRASYLREAFRRQAATQAADEVARVWTARAAFTWADGFPQTGRGDQVHNVSAAYARAVALGLFGTKEKISTAEDGTETVETVPGVTYSTFSKRYAMGAALLAAGFSPYSTDAPTSEEMAAALDSAQARQGRGRKARPASEREQAPVVPEAPVVPVTGEAHPQNVGGRVAQGADRTEAGAPAPSSVLAAQIRAAIETAGTVGTVTADVAADLVALVASLSDAVGALTVHGAVADAA